MPGTPPAPAALWLVRHAESEGNVADVSANRDGAERLDLPARDPDVRLSATGCEQADALGRSWQDLARDRRPDVVLSSPYERAYRTAQRAVAAAGWHDLEIRRDERLRARDLGMLDGFTRSGIERRFPDEAERRAWLGKFYYRPPGGESWADVAARVRAVLETVGLQHAGRRVVVVSHQAVLMLFRYVVENLDEEAVLALDASQRLANTGVVRYRFDGATAVLEAADDIGHLHGLDVAVTEEPAADALPR
jgi:broad specificity phosphatase PhoE